MPALGLIPPHFFEKKLGDSVPYQRPYGLKYFGLKYFGLKYFGLKYFSL